MLSPNTVTRTPPTNVLPANLFVLNPDKATSLVGPRQFPITFDRKIVPLLLLLCSLVAGMIVSLKGTGELLAAVRLSSSGTTTQGQIMSHPPIMGRAGSQDTQGLLYPVIYRFSLPNS